MMRQQNRLGALKVGVARQHSFDMASGKIHQYGLQVHQQMHAGIDLIPQIHAHVQCHLIVATSGGMQFLGDFPHELTQS